MRILLDYRPALRARTGVGEYVHQLARALVADEAAGPGPTAGDVVTLFSSSWSDRVNRRELDGCSIVDWRIPVRVLNLAWHRAGWPPVEWLAGAGYDVAHSLHPLLMPARQAAQVVTVHDLDFLAHPERTRAEIRRDYPALTARHVARADHVIVNSGFTAQEVRRQLGVDESRMTVCRPGAPPWGARDRAILGAYVLFLGTLEPRKNVGTLLDAYAALTARRNDLPELVLGGQATPEAAAWIDRLNEAPLAGRVRFIGYVPPERRRGLYSGAAVFVMPSHHEGFGIPALEAMTLGVPVVAANRGALPEVVGDAGLLVDTSEPAALAAALERVLTDPSLARQLAERGRARSAQFTWRATADAARRAYRLAIEARNLRRHG